MKAYGYRRGDYGRTLLYEPRRLCPCCRRQESREGCRAAKKRARREDTVRKYLLKDPTS